MRITSGGNVGIGTTAPASRLHVYDAGNTFSAAFGASGGAQIVAIGNASGVAQIQAFSSNAFAAYSNLSLNAGGGNVGIGTTSPSDSYSFGKALDVSGINGAALYLRYSTDPSSQFGMIGYDRTGLGLLLATNNALPIIFSTSATERMRITSGGNVGIGTTSPVGRLHILNASGNGQPALELQQSNSGSNILQWRGSAGTYLGVISDVGNVGIGTTSPSQLLDVAGNIRSIGSVGSNALLTSASGTTYGFFNNGAGGLTLTNSGVANVGTFNMSTGVYVATSDRNKKKDFEESNIGLNEVLQLKPTLYRMKSDNTEGIKELGFIAQEVQGIIPSAYQQSGDFIGLNFNPIVAALTKAVQEQQAQINELKQLLNN